ncbi:MAG: transcriptional repressor [Candidatus Bathyarchaeota archaeon]|jgi:Fur family peroxide stress response transcriptional regulator|nr:transcriptional repressor [Candidatus Bathyarchaeota archaeon]NLD65645.1 transcriptional repressor [Thermoproteota archaeon]
MNDQQLITMLREKGFKVTPQRLAICRFVLSSKEHPSVEKIYDKIQKVYPTISLATIYQTLHLLTKIGLLQEFALCNGSLRYDSNISPHLNLICKNCGKIIDYESEKINMFLSEIAKELELSLVGQHLELYVYCNQCK